MFNIFIPVMTLVCVATPYAMTTSTQTQPWFARRRNIICRCIFLPTTVMHHIPFYSIFQIITAITTNSFKEIFIAGELSSINSILILFFKASFFSFGLWIVFILNICIWVWIPFSIYICCGCLCLRVARITALQINHAKLYGII